MQPPPSLTQRGIVKSIPGPYTAGIMPPEHGGCRGGSGEPIKAFGKLQDSFPCARIGQLPSHLTRLFGTVEPLQGFVQNRRHFWSSLDRRSLLLSALSRHPSTWKPGAQGICQPYYTSDCGR